MKVVNAVQSAGTSPLAPIAVAPVHCVAPETAVATSSLAPTRLPWIPKRSDRLPNERTIHKLRHQLYAHGAFMGLARSMLQNPTWSNLLHQLTPDVGSKVDALLQNNAPLKGDNLVQLMAVLENTPVMAAYGTWRSGRGVVPIEWDLWLDAEAPADLSRARIIHGNKTASAKASLGLPEARLFVRESVAGSDVHTGFSPIDWRACYDAALRAVGMRPRKLPIFLDVKSTYSSAEDINAFNHNVEKTLRVDVQGVGSFKFEQLQDLHVDKKIHLFDTPTQVADAQAAGILPRGAIVMFNAGFLLAPSERSADAWGIDSMQLTLLQTAQSAGDLHLTTYIQETVASPSALDVVFRCMNDATRGDDARQRMFTLGWAYGSVNGRAESGTSGAGINMQFAPAHEEEA